MKILKFLTVLMLISRLCFGASSEDFDGAVSVSTITNTTINGATSISGMAWFKMDTYGENSVGRLILKGNNAGVEKRWMFFNDDTAGDGNPKSMVFQGKWSASNRQDRTPSASLSTGTWTHGAFSYSFSATTNVPVLYLGSVTQTLTNMATVTGGNTPNTDDDNLYLGNRQDTTRTFDGRQAYFQVFTKIITQVEVAEAMWKPSMIPSQGLWPMWGDSTAIDLSGLGNAGTRSSLTTSADGPPVMFGGGLPL